MRAVIKKLDQKGGGGFPAIEPRIALFLLMIGGSIFFLNFHSGFWKALLLSVEWVGGIVGVFFGFIFLLAGIGKLVRLLKPKPPQGPGKNSP